MNVNSIFGLFDQEVSHSGNENVDCLYESFKEHPLVKIGMFKKIILNYNFDNNIILNIFKLNKDLDIPDVK